MIKIADLDSLEARLRAVEAAVVELATMGKMMRVLVGVVAISLGVDITGVGV